jgi:uncharacterized membrane protein YkvI
MSSSTLTYLVLNRLYERVTYPLRKIGKILQVAFTYMGTIVGAGFATGQEILHFFTRYGAAASLTIILSTALFIWLGTKIMLLAHDMKAQSYEDLNRFLFGAKVGPWISFFTFIVLFGITSVMLAGAGSVFEEHLGLPYQFGLIFTMILCFVVLLKGIDAILAVNTFVVPLILLFTLILVITTMKSPNAGYWIQLESTFHSGRIWLSPFLYTAFNLALAQAVLVPVGSAIKDRSVLYWGGILGGVGIGLMLLAGHFALSAQMPGITQFQIPMGVLLIDLGKVVQLLFLLLIFAEIFTTLIADVYGLASQIEHRIKLPQKMVIIGILILCFGISQIGFKVLLSTLYPLFGMISLSWLIMMIRRRRIV